MRVMQAGKGYVFCNALPLTKESFEMEVTSSSKDFVQHYITDRKKKNVSYDWPAYYKQLVLPYETLKRGYSKYGFEFIDECTSNLFKQKINTSEYKVIILFSHCINNGSPEESIEYFDSLIRSDDIVAMIPSNCVRIYDFSVCDSPYLSKQSNLLKGENIFGINSDNIRLSIWLYIYAEIFKRIVLNKNYDYLDAFDASVREFRAISKKTQDQ